MEIIVNNLVKYFDGVPVLNHVSLSFCSDRIYCLMGPSGSGKTTFFRILMGLEHADQGTVTGIKGCTVTAVFQEDRLCESFSAVENVAMVFPKGSGLTKSFAHDELCKLLPEDSLNKPVSALSGGMKRRVAVCRAMACPSDIVFMDEPFTGLDENTKRTVIAYIRKNSAGRIILISTHQEEDVFLLEGILLHLPS